MEFPQLGAPVKWITAENHVNVPTSQHDFSRKSFLYYLTRAFFRFKSSMFRFIISLVIILVRSVCFSTCQHGMGRLVEWVNGTGKAQEWKWKSIFIFWLTQNQAASCTTGCNYKTAGIERSNNRFLSSSRVDQLFSSTFFCCHITLSYAKKAQIIFPAFTLHFRSYRLSFADNRTGLWAAPDGNTADTVVSNSWLHSVSASSHPHYSPVW